MKNKLEIIEEMINEGKTQEAEKITLLLFEEALEKEDKELIGYTSKFLGGFAFEKGLFQLSLDNYERAYLNFKEINNSKGIIYSLNGLALLFTQIGDFSSALKYSLMVLHIVNSENSFEIHRFSAINNIAILFIRLKEYDMALNYLNECIELSEKTDDKILNAIIYFNIGEIYLYKKDIEKVKEYLDKSKRESLIVEDNIGISFCLGLEAALIIEEDSLEKGNILFNKALLDMEKYGTKYDVLDLYSIYYRTLYLNKKYEEGKETLLNALELAIEIKSYVIQKEICDMLHNIYAIEEDYEKAYTFLFKYNEINQISEDLLKKNQVKYLSSTYSSTSSKLQLEELEESVTTLKVLSEIGKAVTSSSNLDNIFQVLISNLSNILKLNSFGLAIIDEEKGKLSYNYFQDNIGVKKEEYDLFDESILMNLTIKKREEIVIFDAKNKKEYKNKYSEEMTNSIYNCGSRSLIFCPLIYENEVIGGVTGQSLISHTFSYKNLEILRILSSYIAIAVTNSSKTEYLKKLSSLDALTQLFNRHALNEYVAKEISEDDSKHIPLCIIMTDIDFFKEYNDNYGHVMGDSCVKSVAEVVIKITKKYNGKSFRYGGDEFLIILPNTDFDKCNEVITEIYDKLEIENLKHEYSKISNRVTITAGGVIINKLSNDCKDLYNMVDDVLYEAKRKGRNTYLIKEW